MTASLENKDKNGEGRRGGAKGLEGYQKSKKRGHASAGGCRKETVVPNPAPGQNGMTPA